jgi:hypothetical protein
MKLPLTLDSLPDEPDLSWGSGAHEVRNQIEELRVKNNQTWHYSNNPPDHTSAKDFPILCNTDRIDYYGEGGLMVDQIYRMLKQCDNIRHLEMEIAQSGCTLGADIRSFDWRSGDKICDLETLSLSCYRWEAHGDTPWDGNRYNRGESPKPWLKAMDWSKLRRLQLDRPPSEFVQTYIGKLTGLESLNIRPQVGFGGR